MTALTPVASLDDVTQLETNTPVLGGPGGAANTPAQQLLNRTAFLDKFTASPFRVGRIYGENEPVLLTSGELVKSTTEGNVTNPNTDMTGWVFSSGYVDKSQFQVNTYLNGLVLTPEYFGAVSGEADSSTALNAAIVFCASNNAVLDGRGAEYKANSLVLKDNSHIKNIVLESNLFDSMNSTFTTDYGMLTPVRNVKLDNVSVDGKRELHTNVDTAMDGGRSGVLIRRPIDGLTVTNCKFNNSVTDGIMLFPVDFAITSGDWFSFVKNVTVINTELSGNGRWALSVDSVDGLTMINCVAQLNGLDVAGGGAYTTGKSARLHLGLHYAGALDIEEYHGFAYSKNIYVSNCDFTKNAGASLWMQRTGDLTSASYNITFDNVVCDFGSNNEAYPNKAMLIGGYSTTNTKLSYRNLTINNCSVGDGVIDLIGCDATNLVGLHNVTTCSMTDSVVFSDRNYNYSLLDGYSNFYERGYSLKDKSALWIGENNIESVVNIYNESTIGKSSSINIYDGGSVKSGLKFTKQDDGYDLHFLNGDTEILSFRKYGSIIPTIDNIAQIGEPGHRISRLYGHSMSLTALGVFADNAAAMSGGLIAGDFYRTSSGQVMVVV